MAENEKNRPDNYYVSQREPEAKPPPVLETGVLKWFRENLFNSTLNAVLTIVGIFIVYYSIQGLMVWTVRDANWFSVTANFRNLMLGRYEAEFEWRSSLTLFISVFAMGAAVAIWIRQASRTILISFVVIILSLQVLPRLIDSSMELPSWYAGAGNVQINIAQTSEVAFDSIAFIGQKDDEINISFASEDTSSEESLAAINGFVDNIANTLRNQAANRLEAIAKTDNYSDLIAQQDAREPGQAPIITQSQYDEYVAFIADAADEEVPVLEQYNINQIPVLVEIINPETMEAVASEVLTTADDALIATLPADSWYILRKTFVLEGADEVEGLALLDVRGIYPAAKRESNTAIAFTRRPDGFQIEGVDAPEVDGEQQPFIDIIRNQYRGERPLNHYLRTYISPFFLSIADYVSIVLLIGIAGYAVTELLRNYASVEMASTFATYAMVSIPVVVWVLINGMYIYSVMMWLLLISMALISYLIYKMTQRDGFSPVIAVVGILTYIIFAGIVYVIHGYGGNFDISQIANMDYLRQGFDVPRLLSLLPLIIDDAAIPRFLIWLGIVFIPLAIYMGKNAHIPDDEVKFNTVLLAGFAVVAFIIPAGAFITGSVTVNTEWALQPSDPRNWGGLLLTFMLTIYGIIIAFPIGVGLALGRRSDLPLIKYLCTAYIELVRGSPFITVLFFMQLFIPLINSDFSSIPGSYRAIAATIAFSAAYLAENVRGGLQSLPPGQEEAAQALGLNGWQTISLITLPQALRAVIPALVGQFIGLFKDTTLVAIVGLIDLVGFVGAMVVQAEFIGTRLEGLLFISILYFVVSYVMSYISRLLEASGSGSTRRM